MGNKFTNVTKLKCQVLLWFLFDPFPPVSFIIKFGPWGEDVVCGNNIILQTIKLSDTVGSAPHLQHLSTPTIPGKELCGGATLVRRLLAWWSSLLPRWQWAGLFDSLTMWVLGTLEYTLCKVGYKTAPIHISKQNLKNAKFYSKNQVVNIL